MRRGQRPEGAQPCRPWSVLILSEMEADGVSLSSEVEGPDVDF